nr:phage tail protein [Aeromonas tecta]
MRSTVAPQSQQDEWAWCHPGNNRVGARPSYQFLGPDDETTTLSGGTDRWSRLPRHAAPDG